MGTILPGLQSCNPENNLLLASSGSPPRSGALGPVGPGSGSPIPAEGRHPGCWGLARSASRGPLREGQGRVGPRPAHHPPQPLQPRPLQCFPTACPGWGLSKPKPNAPVYLSGEPAESVHASPPGPLHTHGRISARWASRGAPTSPLRMGRPRGRVVRKSQTWSQTWGLGLGAGVDASPELQPAWGLPPRSALRLGRATVKDSAVSLRDRPGPGLPPRSDSSPGDRPGPLITTAPFTRHLHRTGRPIGARIVDRGPAGLGSGGVSLMAALLLPQPPIPRGRGAAACGGVPEGGALEPGPLGAGACRWPLRGSPGGPSGPSGHGVLPNSLSCAKAHVTSHREDISWRKTGPGGWAAG